jgi:hypothetical protein
MPVFLSITTVVGIIAGIAAFVWLIVPLNGIGIAAAPAGAADESATFSSMLLSRFYIAAAALALFQAALSKGFATFSVSRWFLMTQKLCPNPSLNADVRHAGLRPANGSPVSLFR